MTSDNASHSNRQPSRTWLYVVGGVAMIFVMAGLTLVVGGILLFRQHVHTETIGRDEAERRLERAAARFSTDLPLVELRDGSTIIHRQPERRRQQIEAFHLLVYHTDERRMVDVTIPGWLLRLGPARGSSLKINGIEGLDGRGEKPVSLEDLERHGPGLVIDGRARPRGGPMLAWVE